jgi:hypothetical protein
LIVEEEDVRTYVSTTDLRDRRVQVAEVRPVDLVERLIELERVPGRVEPHQEIRASQPHLTPHLEAVARLPRRVCRERREREDSEEAASAR